MRTAKDASRARRAAATIECMYQVLGRDVHIEWDTMKKVGAVVYTRKGVLHRDGYSISKQVESCGPITLYTSCYSDQHNLGDGTVTTTVHFFDNDRSE